MFELIIVNGGRCMTATVVAKSWVIQKYLGKLLRALRDIAVLNCSAQL